MIKHLESAAASTLNYLFLCNITKVITKCINFFLITMMMVVETTKNLRDGYKVLLEEKKL